MAIVAALAVKILFRLAIFVFPVVAHISPLPGRNRMTLGAGITRGVRSNQWQRLHTFQGFDQGFEFGRFSQAHIARIVGIFFYNRAGEQLRVSPQKIENINDLLFF